jgi:hypothetical protein
MHLAWHGTTLQASDPFWNPTLPPTDGAAAADLALSRKRLKEIKDADA